MKISYVLALFIIFWLLFYTIELFFSTPVVYWSTSQDMAVKLEIKGQEKEITELPDKYIKIWVK
jgi:hypothetical protein